MRGHYSHVPEQTQSGKSSTFPTGIGPGTLRFKVASRGRPRVLYFRPVSVDFETRGGARNFRLGVLNGVWFTVADRLMDPTLVLAAFVATLTPSPLWLGLIIPITEGGWYLPQLLMSG